MSEQIMQVEVRCSIVDLATGERSEAAHEEHCEELSAEPWSTITRRLGQRMLDRTVAAVATIEHDRVINP